MENRKKPVVVYVKLPKKSNRTYMYKIGDQWWVGV